MPKSQILTAALVVLVAFAFAPALANAQATQTNIVYETGFEIETDNLSSWIQWILDQLGADGLDSVSAQFLIYDTLFTGTGQIVRTVQIEAVMVTNGVPNILYNYFISYDWETGEIVASNTNGLTVYQWSDGEEWDVWDASVDLWGAQLDIDVFMGWWANANVNLFDASTEGAIYLRSELDLVVDLSQLLIGISGIATITTEFNAKPVQLRAKLLFDFFLGLYFKLYYDLEMELKIDLELLWGLADIELVDKDWDYTWTLVDRQIAAWMEPDF